MKTESRLMRRISMNLWRLLAERGISQESFAFDYLHMSPRQFARWLSGGIPKTKDLEVVADLLEIDVQDLLM